MAVPLIRSELLDDYGIALSEDAIEKSIRRYQAMLAARQQDPEALRWHYEGAQEIILSIDGLRPEKGHETLYVVRELTGKRVWSAAPLISATAAEVRYHTRSPAMGVERFARASRGHRGVENGCHRVLDVTDREEGSEIREHRRRENPAWPSRISPSPASRSNRSGR
jgi:hypothetical protein